ncbi:hypothetical protein Barb6XT_00527 [Bacteroidales bacterium Barb6XT]|nr:hypothetical protein Barb6XT_00527 [Bacteroidales bacterium Barb6XT]
MWGTCPSNYFYICPLFRISLVFFCPKRARDFSPTCSVAECGVKDDIIKVVLKGQYKPQTMVYNTYIFGRPFRTSLSASLLTPHSATLHVGLKSPVPFGTPLPVSSLTQRAASLYVGLKSFVPSGLPRRHHPINYKRTLRSPERAVDFSPTCSAAECGVKGKCISQ